VNRVRFFASAAAFVALRAPARAFGPVKPGQVAPPFSLPGNHGAQVSLASFKGKPVYLNFFASWCGPCIEETPYVVKLAKRYRPKGLVTLAIDELDEEHGADFAQRFGVDYPILFDKNGDVGNAYGQIGMPMHVFIDRGGRVSLWNPGEMDEAAIDAAIRKILA
jgi:thiol-disulfide isomerase/thioredoxin